jgi:hypothetical protein
MNELIYALLLVPLVLILSTAIFGQFSQNVDRSTWSTEANSTFNKITSQTWQGYNLGSMIPFILIAIAVVGIVLGILGKV